MGPVIGFDLPGCFAERARIPEIALVRVDDRISDSEAAFLQSLSDSVAAVETAGLRIADTVAILGQGSMGLECLQIARLSGAGLIITVDVRAEACRMSRELGADHALNARDCDVVAAIRELTGGIGADVVFECAGGSPKQGLAGPVAPAGVDAAPGGIDRRRVVVRRAETSTCSANGARVTSSRHQHAAPPIHPSGSWRGRVRLKPRHSYSWNRRGARASQSPRTRVPGDQSRAK